MPGIKYNFIRNCISKYLWFYVARGVFEDNNQLQTQLSVLNPIIREQEEEKEFDKGIQDQEGNLVFEGHGTGVGGKPQISNGYDDEKSITEENGMVIVPEQDDVAAATEPVPLSCTTK